MRKHYISVSGGEDTATYNPLEEFTLAAIMTTFNQPKSELERCFRSLLEQELKLNEIIIFDGGSRTDETLNWLDSLAYLNAPEVKVIRGESLDIIETRNRAAKLSNSTFITFVDPDDYFELNHFKLIHNAVKKRLSLDLVFSDVVVRNQLGEILTVNQTGPADFLLLLEHNRLPICSTIRRDFFLTIGGYRKEMEKGCEDWDLWVRAAAHGANSMHVPFASFNYTEKTEGNRSSELKAFNEAQELKLRKFALNLIEELLND
jgi:glycosyltransferase involved in cell wall biosynthesis